MIIKDTKLAELDTKVVSAVLNTKLLNVKLFSAIFIFLFLSVQTTFQEILLPSSGNEIDYAAHV